jgi:hypothetical protein
MYLFTSFVPLSATHPRNFPLPHRPELQSPTTDRCLNDEIYWRVCRGTDALIGYEWRPHYNPYFPNRQPSTKIVAPAKQSSPHHWNFPRRTLIRDLHMALKLQYIYCYITELSYRTMKMQIFPKLDKANPDTGNIRGLKLGGGQAYDRSSD